jgi:multisubunit Na+/H+ antiporter MnhE subunit
VPRLSAAEPGLPAPRPFARRAGVWLLWWVLMMSLWILVDDSLATDELLAGAGAATLAATLAEVAGYQASTWVTLRAGWLGPALRLPADTVRDTGTVLLALGRTLLTGRQPASGFLEVPVSFGDETPRARTRRALLLAGRSVAPNTFALGLDREDGVMVVHQLVPPKEASGK